MLFLSVTIRLRLQNAFSCNLKDLLLLTFYKFFINNCTSNLETLALLKTMKLEHFTTELISENVRNKG